MAGQPNVTGRRVLAVANKPSEPYDGINVGGSDSQRLEALPGETLAIVSSPASNGKAELVAGEPPIRLSETCQ